MRPPGARYTGSRGATLITCVGRGTNNSNVGTVCMPISTLVMLGLRFCACCRLWLNGWSSCAKHPNRPTAEAEDCRACPPSPPRSGWADACHRTAHGGCSAAPSTSADRTLGRTPAHPLQYVCHSHPRTLDDRFPVHRSHARAPIPAGPCLRCPAFAGAACLLGLQPSCEVCHLLKLGLSQR